MSVHAQRGEFEISTDEKRMDVGTIHRVLTRSYWAQGIDEPRVRRSIANSLCFGVFHAERQVGFARVVTDRATFAYLADVFVVEDYRGKGLAKWMMEVITAHPDLQGLRRWILATRDAHGLYRKFGFKDLSSSGRFMERYNPDVYLRRSETSATGTADSSNGAAQ